MISDSLGIRPVWAEINLDHLAHNIREVRRIVPEPTLIMTAVKADGYGHGSQMCAETFLENGADMLAVATPGEGIQLRRKGINAPILCLGYTPDYLHGETIKNDVTATIYSHEQGTHLNKAAQKLNTVAHFHVKIDTGMSRLGYQPDEQAVESIVELAKLPHLELDGVFTHFAVADESDKTYTRKQYSRYIDIVSKLEDRGLEIPIKHVSNSAAVIDLPEYNHDMVRPGIMLYGYYPSPEVDHDRVYLKQVLTLHAQVSHVKDIPAGRGISYGLTYTTETERRIATLPVGYADGYKRSLSNKGYVELNGKKASIVGRICMDQCMVDVTGIPEVKVGDEVTLIGIPGGVAPDGEQVAELLDTITHEVTCQLTRRVPRVYIKDGKPIKVKNYLNC
ncbi:alanine racemase [Candidatus Bathyarchaeota archaeon]|nr:alanine racemase [Candidatus Bathyarchaeota archaeon]